jgi:hypothetical protein
MDEVDQAVFGIVAKIAAARSVTRNQRLYHDLGLAGDDAVELLDEVHARFGTGFTDFRFYDYFPDEGEVVWDRLERLLRIAVRRKPFTVAHLTAVVRRGVWFEP